MATTATQGPVSVAAMAERLAILEDKDAIRELIYRYGYTADTAQYEDFVALLTEDCVWEAVGVAIPGVQESASGAVMTGRAEAMAAVDGPGHAQLANREQHVMANFIIEVEGDTARAIGHLVLTVHHWGGFALGTCRLTRMAFRRENGQWLISEVSFRETGEPAGSAMIVATGLLPGR